MPPLTSVDISTHTTIETSLVATVSKQLGNVNNTPAELIDTAKKYAADFANNAIEVKTKITKQSHVDQLKIGIGNITTTSAVVMLPANSLTTEIINPGKILWHFSGNSQLRTVTMRVGDRTWQEEFARLRLPTSPLFPGQIDLKPKTYQAIYEKLCNALKPVDKTMPGHTVILHGASGLGKTYCAQYYFYHQAASQHQMVAWLSGSSEETFLQGWYALAQQLRNIHSLPSELDDDAVIHDWCENQLGQWLFIIDEVNFKSEWLNARLPRRGGHVLITTHRPHYQLQQNQITLPFSPLSIADSQALLQAYVGRYWQASGYPQEQNALNYLSMALGGVPAALIQMALVVHKKGLSFARIADQFRQPALRACLINDTVYDQLKDQTFIKVTKKGWQQLLAYLAERYPQLSPTQHNHHIKQFVDCLKTQMLPSPSHGISCNVINNDFVIDYWQGINISLTVAPFDEKDLVAWLHCLPLVFNNETQQWQISLAGMSALEYQQQEKPFPIPVSSSLISPQKIAKTHAQDEQFQMPKIPKGIHLSFSLEDSTLKHTEITISAVGKPSEFRVWQLPTINPYFIPRPQLTQALVEKLPQRKAGETSAQLLLTAATGMGGIGKTELARHFITNPALSSHYQRRFWFTATTELQLRLQFQQLANYLGLIDSKKYIEDKELITHIHKWLSIHPGWLMVLDNADDYHSIAPWIPKEGGAVLVTTREPTPGVLSSEQIVPISLLTHEEAVMWLSQLSGRNLDHLTKQEKGAVENLVKGLGYLPLAIAQAAAYLREQPNISLEDYYNRFISLLAESTLAKQEVLHEDTDAYSRKVVASTWILSLRAIEEAAKARYLEPLAQPLLTVCAYLAPKNIPVFLLETFLKGVHHIETSLVGYMVDEYIGQLVRYSLVERSSSTDNAVSMHNLVQEVIFNNLELQQKTFYLEEVSYVLIQLFPYKENLDSTGYATQQLLLPHLEKIERRLNSELINVGDIHGFKQIFLLIDIMNFLGDAYGHIEQGIKQKEVLERLLEIKKKIYPNDKVKIYMTLTNLGNAYLSLGDIEQAEKRQRQALNIVKSNFGVDTVEYANILMNMANIHEAKADIPQLIKSLSIVKDIYVERYGKNNIEVGKVCVNIGAALGRNHQYSKSLDIYREAFNILKNFYKSEEHLEIAILKVNLGVTYGQLGNFDEMEKLMREAYKVQVKIYGPKNAQIAKLHANLGEAFLGQGNSAEALNEYKHAKSIIKENFETFHIEVVKLEINLGKIYANLRNFDRAIKYFTKAIEKFKYLSYESFLVFKIQALSNLAAAYIAQSKANQGIEILKEAMQIIERYNYNTCFEAGLINLNFADALYLNKNYLEAKKYLLLAIEILRLYPEEEKIYLNLAINLILNIQLNLEEAFRDAANQNVAGKLKELIPHLVNINAKDDGQHGRTALHWAVIKQAYPCIKMLLTAGADVMMVDKAGKSSVDYAEENPIPDALFLLLSHHYKLSLNNIDAGKLLRRAAHQNNVKDIKFLLKHIENINEEDNGNTQRTALHWAVIQRATNCVEALIAAGADPTIVDASGKTALDYAKENERLLELLQGKQRIFKVQQK